MILGFLGTLIGMERVVSLSARWAYLAPLAGVLGGAAWVSSLPDAVARWLWLGAGLGLVAIFASILRKQPSLHGAVLLLGSLLGILAVALWVAGALVYEIAPLLAGSLVVTIAGERLELSRLVLPSRVAFMAFFASLSVLTAGLLLTTWDLDPGVKVAGIGMLLLALWLGLEDVVRRTIRRSVT